MEAIDIDELKQQLLQMATITSWLDERSEQALQRVDASTDALNKGLHRLTTHSEQFVEDVTRLIGQQVHQAVAQGASQAVSEFDKQLQSSTRAAQWAAQTMHEQRMSLSIAQRALVWKGLLALFIGAVLATGGAGFVVWDSMRQIKNATFDQDILHATQVGSITRCGDALCVKVGKHPKSYGNYGDYVLLSP